MMNRAHEQPSWTDRVVRRPLAPAEVARHQAELAGQPQAQAAFIEDQRLTELLHGLPPAEVPSNFTSRVLQEVERVAASPQRSRWSFWRRWHGRLQPAWQIAAAACVLVLVLTLEYHHRTNARLDLARSLSALPLEALADTELWRDFDHIQALPTAPLPSVEELTAALGTE